MPYRPQFAFATPPGYRDEAFLYSFDSTNSPGLVASIPAQVGSNPGQTLYIPLQLQTDAVFIIRAWGFSVANLGVQLRDAFGYLLQDSFVPENLQFEPSGLSGLGYNLIPIEPELACSPGATLLINFSNSTNAAIACPKITLDGVKRFRV
jgi:hypothetical protein